MFYFPDKITNLPANQPVSQSITFHISKQTNKNILWLFIVWNEIKIHQWVFCSLLCLFVFLHLLLEFLGSTRNQTQLPLHCYYPKHPLHLQCLCSCYSWDTDLLLHQLSQIQMLNPIHLNSLGFSLPTSMNLHNTLLHMVIFLGTAYQLELGKHQGSKNILVTIMFSTVLTHSRPLSLGC